MSKKIRLLLFFVFTFIFVRGLSTSVFAGCCVWKTGSWSSCSSTCGQGSKTRSVYCIYSNSYCRVSRPSSSTTCYNYSCCPQSGSCAGAFSSYSAAHSDGNCNYKVTSYWSAGKCGGSGKTCYERQQAFPVNGSCPNGYSFRSEEAAASDGICSYKTSSQRSKDAKCGGSNITCYKRGDPVGINGTCGSGTYPSRSEAMSSCVSRKAIYSTFAEGTSACRTGPSNYAIGAKCGGNNPMCFCFCFSWKSSITHEWYAANSAVGCSCPSGGGDDGGGDGGGSCTPTAGTCNAGDYTSASAAAGGWTCKFAYTSYTTSNAACGGSNRTCYRRTGGYSNPTAGTCATGYVTSSSSCPAGVFSQYTTTNATCGGANITCYRCGYDCSAANPDSEGQADCRYCLDRDDSDCPPPSPPPAGEDLCSTTAPNQDDSNKCVLTTQADGTLNISCSNITASNPYVFLQGNSSSDGTENYRPLSCSEVNSQYTTADQCSSGEMPIPVENFCDGDAFFHSLALQCVLCRDVAAPWFQVVNGNIFARGTIQGSNTDLSNLQVMRSDDETCATGSASINGVGIPLAGDKVINITSQNNPTTAANLTNGFANIDPEDYRFFSKNLGFLPEELKDNLKACSDLNSNITSDFTFKDSLICFIDASSATAKLSSYLPAQTDNPTPDLTIETGIKKVIFVNGNLELDREIIINQTSGQANSSLFLLIVSGDIIVSPFLGDYVNASLAGNCATQAPALHGIFLANGTINFATDTSLQNTTVTRNCDKKITVKGSFIGWGKNDVKKGISMSRTFTGCVPGSTLDGDSLPYSNPNLDYNSSTPVITFIYDPNLPNNLPQWVKKNVWARFEVQ